MRQGGSIRALACALVCLASPALAQLPSAQLTSVFPPGGKQGSTVELAIAGADLDDAQRLVFNHDGLTASPKMTPATDLMPAQPVANQFTVSIGAEVPPGIYEVRAVGRFGLSNPRSFVVGTLAETTDDAGNAAADKAIELPIGTTINGRLEASTYDYFRLKLKQGERVLIDVTAQRIDSRLDGTLVVLDTSGRELKRVKHGAGADPVLDFTAPADGTYTLRLYDEVYGGGNDYFYRLTVSRAPFVDFVFPPSGLPGSTSKFTLYGRNLPQSKPAQGLSFGGQALEQVTVEIPLPDSEDARARLALSAAAPLARAWQDAIEYRLPTPAGPANPVAIHFAAAPAVVPEREPNNDIAAAQKITLPCEVVGQFYPERDFDWVEFDAKKGQTYWIEVVSHQLGLPTDPFFALYRVTKRGEGQPQHSEVVQADDLPERGRRNPAAAEFDATHDDPAYKFVVPEDGTYRLLLRDQFGDSRQDPSMVYRLVIREPAPDFRLLAYPVALPPTQQQQNQTPLAAASIRRGGTAAVNVAVQRRDEFDGEIAIRVEGLPTGVTCPGAVLGGGVSEGTLVLVAAEDAPAWAGPIRVIGTAKLGGREVSREARYAVVVWGTPNRQQQPAEFRLAPGMSLGVVDKEMEPALVRIGEDRIYETSLGGNVEIPVTITRRGDFKDPVKLVAVGLSQQMRPKDIALDGARSEGKLELALNQQNIRPGSYTFFMKGETKRKYSRNPEAVAAAEAEQKRLAEMIKAINDEIKSATEANDEAALKAAQEKLKAATALKSQCDKRLDDAKKASQPKDLAVALISTPVRLRIHASPIKLSVEPPAGSLAPGTKQPLSVKVERLFGFGEQVELTLSPPAGVTGLAAANVALKKGEDSGALEISAAENATPGTHACTVRARGRFNNVQVETTATVNVVIERKE